LVYNLITLSKGGVVKLRVFKTFVAPDVQHCYSVKLPNIQEFQVLGLANIQEVQVHGLANFHRWVLASC
jgi:hypothetical protein